MSKTAILLEYLRTKLANTATDVTAMEELIKETAWNRGCDSITVNDARAIPILTSAIQANDDSLALGILASYAALEFNRGYLQAIKDIIDFTSAITEVDSD